MPVSKRSNRFFKTGIKLIVIAVLLAKRELQQKDNFCHNPLESLIINHG